MQILKYSRLQLNKCITITKKVLPNLPMLLIVLIPYIYKYISVGFYIPHLIDIFPVLAIFVLWHIRGLYQFNKGIQGDIPVYSRRLTRSMNDGEKIWIAKIDLPEATQYLYDLENYLENTGIVYKNKTMEE